MEAFWPQDPGFSNILLQAIFLSRTTASRVKETAHSNELFKLVSQRFFGSSLHSVSGLGLYTVNPLIISKLVVEF